MDVRNGYTFIKLLGYGTYSYVWLVSKMIDNIVKNFACKEVVIDYKGIGLQSYKEIDIVSRTNHPNVIKYISIFFDKSTDPKTPDMLAGFYIMPLADKTLDKYIKKTVSLSTQIRLSYEILSGLYYLHKNDIYHCDIKPENILIFVDTAVVADLGLASYKEINTNVCATFYYGPPELLIQKHEYNLERSINKSELLKEDKDILLSNMNDWSINRIDFYSAEIWQLGILIACISLGKPYIWDRDNFDNEYIDLLLHPDIFLRRKGVDEEWIPLLTRMLDRNPYTRIRSVYEVLQYEIFKENQYNVPIPGIIINKRSPLNNGDLGIHCEDYDRMVILLTEIFRSGNYSSASYFCAVDIFYRVLDKMSLVSSDDLPVITLASALLSSNLHDVYTILPSQLIIKSGISITDKEIIDKAILIVTLLDGVIGIRTLYDYAFSRRSLVRAILLTQSCKEYINTDPENIMQVWQNEETIRERQTRKNKRVIFDELF